MNHYRCRDSVSFEEVIVLALLVVLVMGVVTMCSGCQKIDNARLDYNNYPHHLPPGYSMKCGPSGQYLPVMSYGTECEAYTGGAFLTKEGAYIRAWDQYYTQFPKEDPKHNWPICESNPITKEKP